MVWLARSLMGCLMPTACLCAWLYRPSCWSTRRAHRSTSVAFQGDVLAKIEGWVPQIDGIDIGTLVSGWAFDGSNTSATWDGGGTMASGQQYTVTWARD